MREIKKIQTDSRNPESNVEDRGTVKKKKPRGDTNTNSTNKAMYRLYRSDNLGNANEVSTAELEDILANFP